MDGEATENDLKVEFELPDREQLIEDGNRAYDRLKADSQAWREYLTECEAWDSALSDGLEDE